MAEPRRRIQIVMGPRQVGKSTLVGQYLADTDVPSDYYSADAVGRFDRSWIESKWRESRMKMDLRGETERILVIDEVQKIDSWSELVKKEWDEDTRTGRNLKVILLGSSRVMLNKGLNESLLGRFETLKMGYWEWPEMRDSFGFSIEEFVYFGGLPGLAEDIHDEERWRSLMEDSVISPILGRDILEIDQIRNPALLRQVFELGCAESAREVSLNKMQSSMNSGSVPTIKNYLDVLDQAMALKPVQKYSPSLVRIKQSVPKMQVYNSGFRSRYGRFSFNETLLRPEEWGRQVESTVGAFLTGRSVLDDFDLMYWRDSSGHECDFVLKKNGRLVAVEVKSSRAKNRAGFNYFRDLYKDSLAASLIVGPEGLPLEDFLTVPLPDLFSK